MRFSLDERTRVFTATLSAQEFADFSCATDFEHPRSMHGYTVLWGIRDEFDRLVREGRATRCLVEVEDART